MIEWTCKPFSELTTTELYKILQLRAEVFVVEQKCPYLDCDDKDIKSFHLCGIMNDNLVAYSRLLPPNISYSEPSIGRVCTALRVRKTGVGKVLMVKAIEKCKILYGNTLIRISAQFYLKKFYEDFGFVTKGDKYIEDKIYHIMMVLQK